MVLATIFVSLPFVVREVVPVLREIGDEQEQAAATLGATALADVLARHAARDPLGRRLRRRALDRPRARRVRRASASSPASIAGRDRDADAARREALPGTSTSTGAYAASVAAGADRAVHTARHEPASRPKEVEPDGIAVENVSKRFGDFAALDDVSLEVPDGSLTALLGPERLGQVDAAARDRGARGARLRHDRGRPAPTRRGCRRRSAAIGFVFQHYAAFKHMTRARQRRLRAEDPQAAEGGGRGAGRRAAAPRAASTASPTATRRSSPAASASAWRSRARWRSSRACCCSTSRSARSTPTSATTCAPGCGACTRRSHVTTVLVTHDQEEAMEVADQIVRAARRQDRAGRRAAGPLRAARRTSS